MRSVLIVALLLLPATAPATPGEAPARTLVLRPEGQPGLMVDPGRSLAGYLQRFGLRGVRSGLRAGTPQWLSAIEKTRLDARRIWSAPRLNQEEKLERLVRVVQRRFPDSPRTDALHGRLAQREAELEGFSRLSQRARRRVGQSYERAHLLSVLLKEVGVSSEVHSGQLFDVMDRPRGAHAWCLVGGGQHSVLVDPSSYQPLPTSRTISVLSEGRPTVAIETLNGWLYLPDVRRSAGRPGRAPTRSQSSWR